MKTVLLAAALALAIVLCAGARLAGHAPRYVPADRDRRGQGAGARPTTPPRRSAPEWRKGSVVLFGVVRSRAAGPGGQALLKLRVRALEPSNLCGQRAGDDDSCRVTVSEKDFGVAWPRSLEAPRRR